MQNNTESLQSVACNLCGSSEADVLSLIDRKGKPLRTVICRRCGLVYSNPRPVQEKTREFYSQLYRVEYKHSYTPKTKHIHRAGRAALGRYSAIGDLFRSRTAVLDIGSGGGELVYLLRRLGHDACGVEPNEGYARYSTEEYGIPVQVGFIQDLGYADGGFDVITMHHVLEHTEDPLGILQGACRWLCVDGFLVVEVPNVEAVCQAPAQRFHKAHLYNFNQQTLETLGRKAGARVMRTKLSADGGNLLAIFQRSGQPGQVSDEIPGNCERISRIVNQHTLAWHYLSRYPYIRPFRKSIRSIEERIESRKFHRGKEILDSLFDGRSPRRKGRGIIPHDNQA